MILGLDPGPEQSAVVLWDGGKVLHSLIYENERVRSALKERPITGLLIPLVIEKIASFGMPVGAEVFETVFWSGRFAEAYGIERVHRLTRVEIKTHICNSARAKDGNVRQALIDRFGKVGTRKNPGPLFGISSHLWSALAVAVTWHDKNVRAA